MFCCSIVSLKRGPDLYTAVPKMIRFRCSENGLWHVVEKTGQQTLFVDAYLSCRKGTSCIRATKTRLYCAFLCNLPSSAMSLVISNPPPFRPFKRRRRTATAVLAGDFDLRPTRDVLTSLLNGVGPYKEVETEEEVRRSRKRERMEGGRGRKKGERPSMTAKVPDKHNLANDQTSPFDVMSPAPSTALLPVQHCGTSHRPKINIATMQRSFSVTPPPMPSSPRSTPGPSTSSVTSPTSSKRPRTPYDDEPLDEPTVATSPPPQPPPRKKRVAVKKGWKGWVEGSPPPSEKLINLDAVPVLQERRTRSGKSFDAIGVGKETWV